LFIASVSEMTFALPLLAGTIFFFCSIFGLRLAMLKVALRGGLLPSFYLMTALPSSVAGVSAIYWLAFGCYVVYELTSSVYPPLISSVLLKLYLLSPVGCSELSVVGVISGVSSYLLGLRCILL
jgi:hypothetical protein